MFSKIIFVALVALVVAYDNNNYSQQNQQTYQQQASYNQEKQQSHYEHKSFQQSSYGQQQQQQQQQQSAYTQQETYGQQKQQSAYTQEKQAEPEPHHNIDYTVSWMVKDDQSDNYQTREEQKVGNKVKGQYSVREPTGELRLVTYTADENGFHADVQNQPAANNGYQKQQAYQPAPQAAQPLYTVPQAAQPLYTVPQAPAMAPIPVIYQEKQQTSNNGY